MGGGEVPSEAQACAEAVRRVSTKSANTTVRWRDDDGAPPERREENEAALELRVRSCGTPSSSSILGMGSNPSPLPVESDERFSLVMSVRSVRKLSIVSVQILSIMEREARADFICVLVGLHALSAPSAAAAIWLSVLRVDSRGVIRSRAMQAICIHVRVGKCL